jgi:hypothetical protein
LRVSLEERKLFIPMVEGRTKHNLGLELGVRVRVRIRVKMYELGLRVKG